MNKSAQFVIAVGLFFSAGNVALKIIGNLLDGKIIQLNATLAWVAIFWFFCGSLVGYMMWRARR